jgi:lysophospholipase L1-like esterase
MPEFNKNSRRTFITQSAIAAAAGLALPNLVSARALSSKKIALQQDDVILFQGDSITDWGRTRTETTANTSAALGNSYPFEVGCKLLAQYPAKNLKFYNRGIAGDKVVQLAARWDADCLQIKPNVLSILAGVANYWHLITNQYNGTVDTYRDDYKKLLDRTLEALPGVKLIIGEPFALTGVRFVNEKWFPAFDAYRQVARDIADEFHAAFIPYQSIFDDAVKVAPAPYWSLDGVHPSVAGAGLMAKALLEVIKS